MGTDFADGRGNITFGMSTNAREIAYARDRDYQVDVWKDPRFTGNEFFPDFSGYEAYGGINPTQGSYDALFGAGAVAAGSRLYFNADGTAFTGFFQSSPGGVSRFNGDLSGPKWKRQGDGTIGQNFLQGYVQLPLTRYNIYTRGNYEINDWIGVFGQATFTQVTTNTNAQPSPSVNGWAALVPSSQPVPDELRTILDSRVIPVGTPARSPACSTAILPRCPARRARARAATGGSPTIWITSTAARGPM